MGLIFQDIYDGKDSGVGDGLKTKNYLSVLNVLMVF